MRWGSGRLLSLGASTDTMVMPSISNSASALRTSPALAPPGQQTAVQHTPWFPGPGGAPGPGAVGSRARQLDLDAAGHAPTLPERQPGRARHCPAG